MEPSKALSLQDEQFHTTLVRASGNSEMARVHVELTEKMRIIRHLDFTRDDRVDATYNEHACVLQAILKQQNRGGATHSDRAYFAEQSRGQENHLTHAPAGQFTTCFTVAVVLPRCTAGNINYSISFRVL